MFATNSFSKKVNALPYADNLRLIIVVLSVIANWLTGKHSWLTLTSRKCFASAGLRQKEGRVPLVFRTDDPENGIPRPQAKLTKEEKFFHVFWAIWFAIQQDHIWLEEKEAIKQAEKWANLLDLACQLC